MSGRPPVPAAELADFVAKECGPVTAWRNASWDHGESDVWHAALASGPSVFAKRHRRVAKFAQERAAYEQWTDAVGMCPRLVAAEANGLRAMIFEAVDGEPLLLSRVPRALERNHYVEAGRWLRRLHELPWEDTDPLDVAAALAKRSTAWSERARNLADSPLEASTIREVHARVSAPWPKGVAVPARVPCHRDFTARNWLVNGPQLWIIDFEHARPDWSFTDLERVASSIPNERSDLWTAFEAGYGHRLGVTERGLLERLQLHAALSRVVWAVEHQDPAFEQAGLEQLERLLG